MNRRLKIAIGAAAVIVLVAVAIVYIGASVDGLVKDGIEKYGSRILKAEVRVGSVEISPKSGRGSLRGVFIGNPEGFETGSAFELGEVTISLDVGTVMENTVVIREIRVIAPKLTYEMNANGSNLDALRRNVEAYIGGGKTGGKAAEKPAANEESERNLLIEKLAIDEGKIRVSATGLAGDNAEVALPAIEFTNIGKQKGGANAADVAAKILNAVTKEVVTATATLGLEQALGLTKEDAGGIGGVLKDLFGE